ncbi:FAD-dependent monooxygenase sdcF [Fulvia fulva]|uniref:FAD-dependent monooxygenase sdcF n=1 Tax=Passalora fulva TaxID=5499 RepID=A0A9Q8P977_PASFU|nr:FAD-dependent monooxygenase sdcF [Fulvia fulva]KAK4625008.1 FAD-dependent monooxygenase sdcF [Fulvia fulva]UJO17863.1 FAD-dependent monooxygenase sdcF [Fulvia fulva]
MFALFGMFLLAGAVEFVHSAQEPNNTSQSSSSPHAYPQTKEHSCCQLLANDFAPHLSYSGDATYEQFLNGYWSEASKLQPDCIFTATVGQDVALAIGLLSKSQCKFAVRGGGHTGWSGAANTDTGITFDLSQLNETIVASDRTSVAIGAGARWDDVYDKLDALCLHVAGGRYPTVGVSGFILGGGFSFFSQRYGWGCDTVISFELVMADGTLETISASNKPDLFRALKGGSNNFGIVTAFHLKVFPGGDFLQGVVTYDADHVTSVLTAFAETASTPIEQYDPYSVYLLLFSWQKQADDSVTRSISNWLIHTKVSTSNTTTNTIPPFLSKLAHAAPQLNNTLAIQPLHTFLSSVASQDNPLSPVASSSI